VTLRDQLAAIVGSEHVVVDQSIVAQFATDWTRRWTSNPLMVVRPANTNEVSAVVGVCNASRVPIVTQGGNTGLVGGSIPTRGGCLVLSTTRLQYLEAVDAAARQVTVGAGVTIASLQQHVASSKLSYGVDLASRESATIGGTIATNAGGIRVVRNGDTRAQVLGVEAVLASGSVISHLSGLPKDSAGYDVSGLLVGSEGTLAIITSARLRLVPPMPSHRVTALVGVEGFDDAIALLDQPELLAAEFVLADAMQLVVDVTGLPHPLQQRWPVYVLIETANEPRLPADADAVIDRRVWAYRERQTEAASSLGVVHKIDVGVPLSKLQECLDRLGPVVATHRCFVFGHLAEGNLHIEIVGPEPDDESTDVLVLELVTGLGGSISAEHGVGRAKAAHLGLGHDAASVDAMRRIKRALDPEGLLNPGVLFT